LTVHIALRADDPGASRCQWNDDDVIPAAAGGILAFLFQYTDQRERNGANAQSVPWTRRAIEELVCQDLADDRDLCAALDLGSAE
jgi:hypothetical protein